MRELFFVETVIRQRCVPKGKPETAPTRNNFPIWHNLPGSFSTEFRINY